MDNSRLIQLCSEGDKEAISILYRRYGSSMARVIQRYVGHSAAAKDILHDGFLVILGRISEVRQPQKLEYWMGTVMKNLCLKYLSDMDVLEIIKNEDEIPDIPPIDDILSYEELQVIIDRLPDGYRRIFKLAVLEGKSHKEIGRMLGIAPHSASSQLYHARILLQRMIIERKRELGLITMLVIASGLWFLLHRSGLEQIGERIARTEQTETVTSPSVHIEKESATADASQPGILPSLSPSPAVGKNAMPSLAAGGNGNIAAVTDSMSAVPAAMIAMPELKTAVAAADTVREKAVETTGADRQKTERDTAATQQRYFTTPVYRYHKVPETRRIARAEGVWSVGVQYGMGTHISASSGMQDMTGNHPSDINPTPSDSTQETDAKRPLAGPIPLRQQAMPVDRPEHEIPLSFGINVGRQLTSRLSVESGLTYTLLRTRLKYYCDGVHISRNVRNSYIGIPLKLNYRMFERSSFSVYGTLGAAIDIPVGKQFSTRTSKPLKADVLFPHLSNRVQVSSLFGVGVQYSLSPRVGLYFEPSLRYYFNNHSSMPTYWQEHPWSFSFPLGVRITW